MRRSIILPSLIALVFSLFACSNRTPVQRLIPKIENMAQVNHYFGEPTATLDMPLGRLRSEWLLNKETTVAGQYVEQKIYIGHDRDGFPRYITRNVFVPEHRKKQYCRLFVYSDSDGKVLSISHEGNDCDALLKNPTTY